MISSLSTLFLTAYLNPREHKGPALPGLEDETRVSATRNPGLSLYGRGPWQPERAGASPGSHSQAKTGTDTKVPPDCPPSVLRSACISLCLGRPPDPHPDLDMNRHPGTLVHRHDSLSPQQPSSVYKPVSHPLFICLWASLVAQMVENLPASAGDLRLTPGAGRSRGEGNGNQLQYSCLERSLAGYSPWGCKSQT